MEHCWHKKLQSLWTSAAHHTRGFHWYPLNFFGSLGIHPIEWRGPPKTSKVSGASLLRTQQRIPMVHLSAWACNWKDGVITNRGRRTAQFTLTSIYQSDSSLKNWASGPVEGLETGDTTNPWLSGVRRSNTFKHIIYQWDPNITSWSFGTSNCD